MMNRQRLPVRSLDTVDSEAKLPFSWDMVRAGAFACSLAVANLPGAILATTRSSDYSQAESRSEIQLSSDDELAALHRHMAELHGDALGPSTDGYDSRIPELRSAGASGVSAEPTSALVPKTPTAEAGNPQSESQAIRSALPYAELSAEIYDCNDHCKELAGRAGRWVPLLDSREMYKDRERAIMEGQAGGMANSTPPVLVPDSPMGFRAAAYQNAQTNDIAIVYEGTSCLPCIKDWATNLSQPFWKPSQYSSALDFAQEVERRFCSDTDDCRSQVTLAGHSLGGGLAQYAAAKLGRKAYTFNAAGLWAPTKRDIDMAIAAQADVTHFRSKGYMFGNRLGTDVVPYLGSQVAQRTIDVPVDLPLWSWDAVTVELITHSMERLRDQMFTLAEETPATGNGQAGGGFGGGSGGSWGDSNESERHVSGSGESAHAVNGPPHGSEACKKTFHEVPIGGQACGIELKADARVLASGAEIQNVIVPDQDAPPEAVRLIVIPSSPSGRYTVVKACTYECGGLFVVDHAKGVGQSFQGALYGPANWIAWTEDEQYFLLQNYDDGVNWLQLVHLPEGRIENLSSFDTHFVALMNAEKSFEWLGPRRFQIALMDACMEEPCHGLEYPRDLTRVEFEIVDGRLEVKTIEDPSKVPAVLRDALQARQTRVELADGTVLNGEISAGTLTFESSLGAVPVSFQDVQSYKDEAATLNDGSVLKGRFGEGIFEITTSRKSLKVPAKEIVGIQRGTLTRASAGGGSASPAPGQGVLTGRILDNFRKPVGNATVRILGSSLEARTDSDGRYRLNYVPGEVQVAIQALGYDPVQFGLALSAPTEYPVEDKVLLRLPPGPGVYYWDTGGWTALQSCKLQNTVKIAKVDVWEPKGKEQKETYRVIGTPSRIQQQGDLALFDHTGSGGGDLVIHRVNTNSEIVTDTYTGGGGFGAILGDSSKKKATSQVAHLKRQVFPGRDFLSGDFGAGVYAIVDLTKHTCFQFQVGPDQPRTARTLEKRPTQSQTLSVDGKTVSYWPASSGSKKDAYFQMESKGYRNTYKLDCTGRRFLWTENIDLATGAPTDNVLGAEWKPLNHNSTVSNAVYDAICPSLLKSKR